MATTWQLLSIPQKCVYQERWRLDLDKVIMAMEVKNYIHLTFGALRLATLKTLKQKAMLIHLTTPFSRKYSKN